MNCRPQRCQHSGSAGVIGRWPVDFPGYRMMYGRLQTKIISLIFFVVMIRLTAIGLVLAYILKR